MLVISKSSCKENVVGLPPMHKLCLVKGFSADGDSVQCGASIETDQKWVGVHRS